VAPAAAPPAPAAVPAAGPVTIEHQDVGCIVAGQYPKLEACFRPDASVGRGRVLFRAAGTDPWYYVDMSRDGPCYAALLPKPKPDLKGMEYFVDVMDKAFVEVIKPDRAPGQPYTPRVVKKQQIFDSAVGSFQGDAGGFPVGGTATDAGAVTLTMGGLTFNGTYNRTNMDLAAATSVPGLTTVSMTLKVIR
jgi:hypothetical protein